MNTSLKTLAVALGACTALASQVAQAESSYGYAPSGTGTVTATARVNLSVTVPKLILLRVGSTNTTVDTLSWTVDASIPAVPTTPVAGNNTNVDWDGTAPGITVATPTATIVAKAWTNATAGTINCSVGAWSQTGGPTNAQFTVSAGAGTLPHPGANLGACASTSFPSNTLAASTWTYTLGGTPSTWSAGVYTAQVTYTATGI